MSQQRRTAQRAEIVPSGLDSSRDIVSGPATRWMTEPEQFSIEQMMNLGQTTGTMVTIDLALHQTGGSESYETPISSAKEQVVRFLPMTAVWLVLTVGLV